jgi:hypothetical protein
MIGEKSKSPRASSQLLNLQLTINPMLELTMQLKYFMRSAKTLKSLLHHAQARALQTLKAAKWVGLLLQS